MSGIVKKGSSIDVFTAGWWSQLGSKFKYTIEPFFAGWFTNQIQVEVNQTTKPIIYKTGKHVASIKKSNDYKNFSKLPSFLTQKCSPLYDGERELRQVLSQEAITKFGIATQFYRVGYDEDVFAVDKIFGENENRTVLNMWDNVMMWYKLQRENRVWTKFGIDSADTFTAMVPKAHFMHVTGGYFPQGGDLFIEKATGRVMEVLEREEGEPMATAYQSRQYMWELKVVLYNRQEFLAFNNITAGSKLDQIMKESAHDKLDIKNDVDVKKESVIYEPKPNESPQKNPFGSW